MKKLILMAKSGYMNDMFNIKLPRKKKKAKKNELKKVIGVLEFKTMEQALKENKLYDLIEENYDK